MGLSVGIVGLPNAGKSTLFNALLGRQVAKVESYPFCTIEPNTGVISVPDARLEKIAEIVQPQEVVPAPIKFIDIAGLVKGAHKGLGLGNKFLAHIRECDAILYLLRDFDGSIPKAGSVSPRVDLEVLKTELALKDLETLARIAQEKANTDEKKLRKSVAEKLIPILEKGVLAQDADLSEEERKVVDQFFLLTMKPFFVVINVNESADFEEKKKEFADLKPIVIAAKFEADLADLSEEERKEFLFEKGFVSALDQVITSAYQVLGLITFYTIKGGKETRAWPIRKGANIIEAAELVHTDFAQKFIKAEVVSYQDFVQAGGWEQAKSKGKVATEGRDYQVADADIIEFKISK